MKGVVLKLIAFFAVCLVFTGWLAFTIGNIKLFQDTYELTATFDDVTGLLADDNVKVAGVPVGKVTGIEIAQGRARVTFTVRDGVKVPTDSKAAVRWRNLLGQRYLYVYPGSASTTLEDGDAVPETRSVVDLGELFNRLGPIVKAVEPEKVNQFLDTIVAALDGNEAKLRQAIADLAVLADGLASRDEAIGRLIENTNTVTGAITAREAQIKTVLDNLLAITTTFSEHADVLDRATVEVGRFADSFGALLADNRAELDRTVAGLDQLVEVVRQKLPALDRALAALDDGTSAIFRSSMYGEWLNQTIPCGRVGYDPRLVAVDECVKTAGDVPPGTDVQPGPEPPSGAAGLTDLFGTLLEGSRR